MEKKFTGEELLRLIRGIGTDVDNYLDKHAFDWANSYDFDSDCFDVEMAIHDAVIEGVSWVLDHLKDNRNISTSKSNIDIHHYYVFKDGHCLSDFDDEYEARKYAKDVNGELAIE